MKKLFILILIVIYSCSPISDKKDLLFVSIPPQKFILDKLTGNKFDIEIMVKPGFTPETYEPLPEQIFKLAKAKAFMLLDLPFEEKWVSKIKDNNKNLLLFYNNEGIKKRKVESLEHFNSTDGHNHKNMLYDPHIWLDPINFKTISENIFNALLKIYPQYKDDFLKNLNDLNNELETFHQSAKNRIEKKEIAAFLIYHPSYGYFADRYSILQIPIEFEGKQPSPKELDEVSSIIKKYNLTKIFIQEQFASKAVEAITNSLNLSIIKTDPLTYDYIKNLDEFVNAL